MRSALLASALALGCAAPSAHELRLEGERTLAACGQRRVDTTVCLSLEVIQAEYELCLREQLRPRGCEAIWQAVAELGAPAQTLQLPPLSGLFSDSR